jgi:hypothetical protein
MRRRAAAIPSVQSVVRRIAPSGNNSDTPGRRSRRTCRCGSRRSTKTNAIPLTQAALADYLISQSNAEAAIASGQVSATELRMQIITDTAGIFTPDETAEVIFGMRVWTAVRRA